eukprot:5093161-Pleurochrysis_carterae.AAC.1
MCEAARVQSKSKTTTVLVAGKCFGGTDKRVPCATRTQASTHRKHSSGGRGANAQGARSIGKHTYTQART